MTLLTSPETMVQLCFLESVKPIFDKFLESFQVEGPLIHNLYPCMVLLGILPCYLGIRTFFTETLDLHAKVTGT